MAISLVSLNSIAVVKEDPELAVRHVTQTLQLVNQRLSRADAVSDASVAVVVMMAQYERHQERYVEGLEAFSTSYPPDRLPLLREVNQLTELSRWWVPAKALGAVHGAELTL